VGSVERGERNISIDNMERLALSLDVPLEKLIKSQKS
jgi:transcriptional regulator with XRE-family HTH domain